MPSTGCKDKKLKTVLTGTHSRDFNNEVKVIKDNSQMLCNESDSLVVEVEITCKLLECFCVTFTFFQDEFLFYPHRWL